MATTKMPLPIEAASPGTSAIPAMTNDAGTNFPVPGYSFTIASNQAIYWHFPLLYYGSGSLVVNLLWFSAGGSTTGNVRWDASMNAITPGDAQSILTDSLSTVANTTTTVNGTARGVTLTQVTVAATDSAAEGDRIELKVTCNSAGTMASNAVLVDAFVTWSDT